MPGKRTILLITVLLLSAVVLQGCDQTKTKTKTKTKKAAVERPVMGGNLTYFLIEPAFIDPYNAQETEGTNVVANICDSLVDFDPITSEVVPAVAERWEPSEGGKVWTVTLRKGTKFHNGREVEAADFKYEWERIADPATKPAPSDISYHLAPIVGYAEMQGGKAKELSGVKVRDKNTLEITLTKPFSDFISVLGHPALAPAPKEEVEKDPKAFADNPVCNGPFKMKGPWKHEQEIVVERFDDYYGKKTYLDTVTFRIFKDMETGFLEFKAGNVDFANIPNGQMKATVAEFGKGDYEVKKDKGALMGLEAATYYLNMNNENKFLKNADLRRAISLAINREAIAKTVFEDTRQPATGLVPPGVVGFVKNAGKYSKFDKKQAEELLTQAGYPGGKGLPTFKLVYNTGSDHEQVMQVVQANLKDIGINTDLAGLEFPALIDARQKGDFELARDGWVLDYPIEDNILYALFNSEFVGQDNTSRYKNPSVDELLNGARTDPDDAERVSKYSEAERAILDDAAVAPIVFYAHRHVGQKWVRGLTYSPLAIPHLETAWKTKEAAK